MEPPVAQHYVFCQNYEQSSFELKAIVQPELELLWLDELNGNLLHSGAGFFPFQSIIDPTIEDIYTFKLVAKDTITDEFSDTVKMHLIVSDCSSELDCPVYVIMEDSEGNGWDGAKLNVRIDEGTPLTINMNSTEGKVKFQKIAASNGGFIDLEYDHGLSN